MSTKCTAIFNKEKLTVERVTNNETKEIWWFKVYTTWRSVNMEVVYYVRFIKKDKRCKNFEDVKEVYDPKDPSSIKRSQIPKLKDSQVLGLLLPEIIIEW